MGKVCHFFHACRHGVRQFGCRVGIAPKNADDHQKQNGRRNVFVQGDDRAFVGIDTVSHEFGAVKTYGPSNDENGCHEPVDVARDWMVVFVCHEGSYSFEYGFAAIIKMAWFQKQRAS